MSDNLSDRARKKSPESFNAGLWEFARSLQVNSRKPTVEVTLDVLDPQAFAVRSNETVLTWVTPADRSDGDSKISLRKEVIQPQVPLRLPCYDLVPVTEPSVGTSVLRQLRLFPAPMT